MPGRAGCAAVSAWLVLACSVFGIVPHVRAQVYPRLQWQRFYGTPGDDVPLGLALGPDSSAYLLTRADADGHGHLFCIDLLRGGIRWQRQLLLPDPLLPVALAARDTVVAVAGQVQPDGLHAAAPPDYGLRLYRADGKLLWTKRFGTSQRDAVHSVALDRFGGMLLVGETWSVGEGRGGAGDAPECWALLLNRNGEVHRGLRLAGAPLALAVAGSGSYFVLLRVPAQSAADQVLPPDRFHLAKVDFAGNLLWRQALPLPERVLPLAITACADGGVALVGAQRSETQRLQHYLARFDGTGRMRWQRSWGEYGSEVLCSAAELPDGGLLLGGYSQYDNWANPQFKGQQDAWLIRTDKTGVPLWQRSYGGPEWESLAQVLLLGPNQVLAAGRKRNTFGGGDGSWDAWLLKLRELPCGNLQARFALPEGPIAVGQTLSLRNLTQVADLNAASWRWDFGDGTGSNERIPRKAYAKPGSYRISLQVQLADRCQSVYIAPEAVEVH